MVVHTLRGIGSDTEKIQIEENKEGCLIAVSDTINGEFIESTIELDLERLHTFIGTLLHVQQKLKNR